MTSKLKLLVPLALLGLSATAFADNGRYDRNDRNPPVVVQPAPVTYRPGQVVVRPNPVVVIPQAPVWNRPQAPVYTRWDHRQHQVFVPAHWERTRRGRFVWVAAHWENKPARPIAYR